MKNVYREVFDEVLAPDRLRQEVWNMTGQERSQPKRLRVPAAGLIAAALVLALSGTALAAAGVPDTLKGWFSRQWTELSGNSMSCGQLALIDRLAQQMGTGDTCGDSSMWLLLRVSGDMDFNEAAESYSFDGVGWSCTPGPDGGSTPGG